MLPFLDIRRYDLHSLPLDPREVLHAAVPHVETNPPSFLSWLAFLSWGLCAPIALYFVKVTPHKIFFLGRCDFANGSFDPHSPWTFSIFGVDAHPDIWMSAALNAYIIEMDDALYVRHGRPRLRTVLGVWAGRFEFWRNRKCLCVCVCVIRLNEFTHSLGTYQANEAFYE